MDSKSTALWEVHLRIPDEGPVAISCKHGDERLTDGVARPSTPADALHLLERLLEPFQPGDQIFVTARTHDSELSMWQTHSKAAGMYWCASALAKLWRQAIHGGPLRARRAEAQAESRRQRREPLESSPRVRL